MSLPLCSAKILGTSARTSWYEVRISGLWMMRLIWRSGECGLLELGEITERRVLAIT